MRWCVLFIILWVLLSGELLSQEPFRVMFYNVENLFDTRDDPMKEDDDFLPDGFMHWTPWKYWEKLRNITRVITAVGGMHSPALVGLCEVENESVLHDLTRRSPLRAQEYAYLITHSPDRRGIDVALLYQQHQFKPLETHEYEIHFRNKRRASRNILHVTGQLINGEILDLFVCHLPSRSEGQRATEPSRIEATTLLRRKCDSLLSRRAHANILIMGDFNDHPDNRSLSETLQAKRVGAQQKWNELYNLFSHFASEDHQGSYKYRGRWEVLDQMIVNGSMLKRDNPVYVKGRSGEIYNEPFLLEEDERYYGKKPYRTNLGPRYMGGFSDHLPIYTDLLIRQP